MTKNDIKLENVPEGVEIHDTPEGKELCIRPDDISRSKGWGFALCALCILIVNISISQSFDGVPNQYLNYLFGILYIAALLMCLLALISFYSANRRRKVNYIVQLKRSNTNFSVAKYQGKKQKWLDTFDWIETTVELPHEIARARPPKASIIMDTRRPFKAALADACGIDDILKDLHEKKLAEDARTGKDLKGSCVCLRFRGLCKQADISGLSRPKAYWLKIFLDAWVKKL